LRSDRLLWIQVVNGDANKVEKHLKLYEGKFLKKDGTSRTMKFVKTSELPQSFLEKVTSGGTKPKLSDGFENVWDVENEGFRVFNHNTLQGELKTTEVTEEVLKTNR